MFSIEFRGKTDWKVGRVFGPGDNGEWYKVTYIDYDPKDDWTLIVYEEVNRDA